MAQFTPKRHHQILERMLAKVLARSGLTDIADTSAMKHVLSAAARSDDDQYYQMSLILQLFSVLDAEDADLDERIKEILPGTLRRRAAAPAVGTVVFSRAGTSGTTAIAVGTRVKATNGVEFRTTAAGEITAASPEQIVGYGVGRNSAPVAIVAIAPGESGNVVPGTIIKFVAKPAGIDEVTNLLATQFGVEKESDDALRARAIRYTASLSRCPKTAIEDAVLGAQDPETGETLLYSRVLEDFEGGPFVLFIDNGFGTAATIEAVAGEVVTAGLAGPPPDTAVGGETRLHLLHKPVKKDLPYQLTSSTRGVLVEGPDYDLIGPWGLIIFRVPLSAGEGVTADYTRYTGLMEQAQKIIDGDPTDRDNYPGYRAAGTVCELAIPQILIQNVTVVLVIEKGFSRAQVIEAVRTAIKLYVNNLEIGDNIVRHRLIKKIMVVPGVYDCAVETPAFDIFVGDDQMPRTTDANIVVT